MGRRDRERKRLIIEEGRSDLSFREAEAMQPSGQEESRDKWGLIQIPAPPPARVKGKD